MEWYYVIRIYKGKNQQRQLPDICCRSVAVAAQVRDAMRRKGIYAVLMLSARRT